MNHERTLRSGVALAALLLLVASVLFWVAGRHERVHARRSDEASTQSRRPDESGSAAPQAVASQGRSAMGAAEGPGPSQDRTHVIHVRDCVDGKPVERAEVVDVAGRSGSLPLSKHLVHGQSGGVSFQCVLHAENSSTIGSIRRRILLVRAPGYAPRLFEEDHTASVVERELCLQREAILDVRLTDRDGVAASGFTVRLRARTTDLAGTPSDSSGADRYRAGEGLYIIPSPRVDPATGRKRARGIDGDQEWLAMTRGDGRCTIGGLPSGVRLTAEVLRGESLLLTPTESFELSAGERRLAHWTLPEVTSLDVWVHDQNGVPVARQVVSIVEAPVGRSGGEAGSTGRFLDPSMISIQRGRTDDSGRVTFEALPHGDYLVGLIGRGAHEGCDPSLACARATLAAVPVDREVQLRAHRGIFIRGSVNGPAGEPVRAASVIGVSRSAVGRWLATTGTDGQFCVGPIEPGSYELTAHHTSGMASTTIEVAADQEARAVMIVEPPIRIALQLRPAAGPQEERFVEGSFGGAGGIQPGRVLGAGQSEIEFAVPAGTEGLAYAVTTLGRVVLQRVEEVRPAAALQVSSVPSVECALVSQEEGSDLSVVFSQESMPFAQVQLAARATATIPLPSQDVDVAVFHVGELLAEKKLQSGEYSRLEISVPSLSVVERRD